MFLPVYSQVAEEFQRRQKVCDQMAQDDKLDSLLVCL